VSDVDQMDEDARAVSLMTLHSAKGLEFDVVFMTGLEEGVFPHSRSLDDPIELEEERRLCYVGMTRARQRLYMCFTRERTLYGATRRQVPSRFLTETDPDCVEWHGLAPGDEPGDVAWPHGGGRPGAGIGRDEPYAAGWGRGVRVARSPLGAGPSGRPTGWRAAAGAGGGNGGARGGGTGSVPDLEEPAGRGEAVDFKPGDRVVHRKFGEGTIVMRRGEGADAEVTIAFPDAGLKTFIVRYANLRRA
ncbi:MAG: ATP-dependent DNA helicase PcrA, partial [Bacillota bacterium]